VLSARYTFYMEKPKSPWQIREGTPIGDGIFEIKTVREVREVIKKFAEKEGITYTIDDHEKGCVFGPENGDFEKLKKEVERIVNLANDMLEEHKRDFRLDADDLEDTMRVTAVRGK